MGFHTFKSFDGISTHHYNSLRLKPLQPGRVLTLHESHPSVPDWSSIGRLADRGPGPRRLPAELLPHMNQYHELFFRTTLAKEIIDRWYRRQVSANNHEFFYWRRLDLLEQWIMDRRYQATYEEWGRKQSIFRRAAERSWMQGSVFEHVAVRVDGHQKIHRIMQSEYQMPGTSLEHPQIFAGMIMLKHRKWMASRAYGGHMSHSHRVFSDVSNGIVRRGHTMFPRVPFARMA